MGWMRVLWQGAWSWLPVYVTRSKEIELVRDPLKNAKATLEVATQSRDYVQHGEEKLGRPAWAQCKKVPSP